LSPTPTKGEISDLIQRILESSGLTLFQLSRQSRQRYADPRFHIPHQFYSDVRLPSFTPSLEQIFSLSVLTDYRLLDWMTILGFELRDIPRMQAVLPTKRTRLLDTSLCDPGDWIPRFNDVPAPAPTTSIFPLSQVLSLGSRNRTGSLTRIALRAGPPTAKHSPFLYVKVGWQDAFAYPDLLPGSIVRVDTRTKDNLRPSEAALFLIEHARGFCLCRIHSAETGRITIRSTELPYAQLELALGRQARILGVADAELRPLVGVSDPQVPQDLMSYGSTEPIPTISPSAGSGPILRFARTRAGLSFREASALSRQVAIELGDPRYFCAPGALSYYESCRRPPRRIQKLIALSIIYALPFQTILTTMGLDPSKTGHRPLPESVLPHVSVSESPIGSSRFLNDLLQPFEELPSFLADAARSLFRLPKLSLRDVYRLGTNRGSLHPYLKGAALAIVNRRNRKPISLANKPLSAQPLYLLLTRSAGYLVTACQVEGNVLIAQPFADGFDRPRLFRNGVDAEVLGRVVGLVRWISNR
jgi:transcriptional regulator with XRE-family HTH domain